MVGVAVNIMVTWFKKNETQDRGIIILQEQLKSMQEMNMVLIDTNKNHIHTLSEQMRSNECAINDVRLTVATELAGIKTVLKERLPNKGNGLK